MTRIVVASAARFETKELVTQLHKRGVHVTWIETGVGLTNSSSISANLRSLVSGRDVIFCATGGIISSHFLAHSAFGTPSIFIPRSVQLNPYDVRSQQSYLLSNFEPPLVLENSLNFNAPDCVAMGSLGITKVNESIKTDGNQSPQIETIELYGVASNWSTIAKSFTAVIASTNFTGPDAHVQWKYNFADAANISASFVINELKRIKNI